MTCVPGIYQEIQPPPEALIDFRGHALLHITLSRVSLNERGVATNKQHDVVRYPTLHMCSILTKGSTCRKN